MSNRNLLAITSIVLVALLISYVAFRFEELLHERQLLLAQNSLHRLLKMPYGFDQHYEKIRNELFAKFKEKGSEGRLLFYVMQVLHDTGNYNNTVSCQSYLDTHNVSCQPRAKTYLEALIKFKTTSDSDISKIQSIYEWTNAYLLYTEDESDFPRFPIETLALGYGDCEDQAMVISAVSEALGFETALSIIHDDDHDLHHCFCLIMNTANVGFSGTLLKLNEYPEAGQTWFVLDPAYNHEFFEEPSWIAFYKNNGTVEIPSSLCQSMIVDRDEFEKIKESLSIT